MSALGGGDAAVTRAVPHCDYYDAGVREALAWIARDAAPAAQVASDVDWSIRFYAARDGRGDLASTPLLAGRACRLPRPCYVLVQPGRVYRHNLAAVERLASRAPDFAARVRGTDAVKVYRLDAGESPFPSVPAAAAAR